MSWEIVRKTGLEIIMNSSWPSVESWKYRMPGNFRHKKNLSPLNGFSIWNSLLLNGRIGSSKRVMRKPPLWFKTGERAVTVESHEVPPRSIFPIFPNPMRDTTCHKIQLKSHLELGEGTRKSYFLPGRRVGIPPKPRSLERKSGSLRTLHS